MHYIVRCVQMHFMEIGSDFMGKLPAGVFPAGLAWAQIYGSPTQLLVVDVLLYARQAEAILGDWVRLKYEIVSYLILKPRRLGQALGDFSRLQPQVAFPTLPVAMTMATMKAAAGARELELLGASSGSRGNLAAEILADAENLDET